MRVALRVQQPAVRIGRREQKMRVWNGEWVRHGVGSEGK